MHKRDRADSTRPKKLRTGRLPRVGVLDILPDCDPDRLVAIPANWPDDADEAPRIIIRVKRNDRAVPGPGERILARMTRGKDGQYEARAMKILPVRSRARIGVVRIDRGKKQSAGARLLPIDRKQREMFIAGGDLNGAGDGDLVEVETMAGGRMMTPTARVKKIIGNPVSEKVISLIALHDLEIPHHFCEQALKEAENAFSPPPSAGVEREDWLHIPFLTIDPASARDHDDAVFAKQDPDMKNPGGFIVCVAIADVAAHVKTGSAMDREAFLRGNSVYFPDRVIPMLPERISNDLCSLKEGEERPALAVRMVIDSNGKRLSHSFHRVNIRIALGLSYTQAQAAFDGKPDEKAAPFLESVLLPLWRAYLAMRRARNRRAPLDLDLPERRIVLDENGLVERVFIPARLEANRLIEEMMIAANVCAARTLEEHKVPLIYRVHEPPAPEKLSALKDFLDSMDIGFSTSASVRPDHFNRIMQRQRSSGNFQQVCEMILRTQSQAEYSPQNQGHFGLNLNHYAHFTSPIRRYADLVIHRGLIRACKLGDDGLGDAEIEKLKEISEHISMTERRAMAAERQTNDRLIAVFLSSKINARFSATISGVTRSGLFVKLDETGADGFVPAFSLGRDYFVHVEAEQAMIGEKTGERFRLGDPVEVKLVEALPMAGSLRFEMLSGGDIPDNAADHHPVPRKARRGRGRKSARPGKR